MLLQGEKEGKEVDPRSVLRERDATENKERSVCIGQMSVRSRSSHRTMKRLMALSLGTALPVDTQLPKKREKRSRDGDK
jgi:hypothetical protein